MYERAVPIRVSPFFVFSATSTGNGKTKEKQRIRYNVINSVVNEFRGFEVIVLHAAVFRE